MAEGFKVPKLPPASFLHKNQETADECSAVDTKSPPSDERNTITIKEVSEGVQEAEVAVVEKSRDQQAQPVHELSYNEPTWSGAPPRSSSFLLSVIKNGVQVDSINLIKPFITFGRLPQCDIHLEHPSISRCHAILQYRPIPPPTPTNTSVLSSDPTGEVGFYVYDLGSTHGSYLNKNKLQTRQYYRVRVGQVMRFGGSTRIFVLDVSLRVQLDVIMGHVLYYFIPVMWVLVFHW